MNTTPPPWTIPVIAAVSRTPEADSTAVGLALATAIENADGDPRLGATCYLLPNGAERQLASPTLELYTVAIHIKDSDEPDDRTFDQYVTRARTAMLDADGVAGVAVLPLSREDFLKAVGNATLVAVSPTVVAHYYDPQSDR